jgi:NADPH-dependent 2,4-dienoyl-CoA reductase/sulfur reductase-like enzyme
MADADVVVVGSGPAGLGAALALEARGIARVVVLEREAEAGGVPRHCGHPPYGLREFGRIMAGPEYARRLVARARDAGVEIRTRTTVTRLNPDGELELATAAGARRLAARRVILATGVRETPRPPRLVGGDRPPAGVMNTGTLQAYVHLQGLVPFRRPLIVGTELVALSALLTCRRAGIRPVAMVEANARVTTRAPFGLLPPLAGVPLRLATELAEIRGRARVEAVVLTDRDGRRETVACDGVLFTGGFVPAAELIRTSHLALDHGTGGPVIDQFGRCSDPAYVATGNLLRPVENAGWCHREGRRVGGWVADDLAGRLPPAADAVPVGVAGPLRFALPQRIVPGADGGLAFQLRVAAPVAGDLQLAAGETVLRRARIRALPERRVTLKRPPLTVETDRLRLAVLRSNRAGWTTSAERE